MVSGVGRNESTRQALLQSLQSEWRKRVDGWGKRCEGRQRGMAGRAKNSYPVQLLRGPQLKSGAEKLVFT